MPRQLKCPRCQTVNTIADGAKPSCASCGFGTKPGAAGAAGAPGAPGAQAITRPSGGPAGAVAPRAFSAGPAAGQKKQISGSAIGAAAVFGIVVVLGVLIQFDFLHWSSGTVDADGTSIEMKYNMWGGTVAAGDTEGASWWSDEDTRGPDGKEDIAGLWLLRFGGPLLLVALAFVVVSGIAVFLDMRNLANNCGWAAFSIAASGVIVFALGVWQNQEQIKDFLQAAAAGSGSSLDISFSWDLAFYFGIGIVVLTAVGTYLAAMRAKPAATPGYAPQRPMA